MACFINAVVNLTHHVFNWLPWECYCHACIIKENAFLLIWEINYFIPSNLIHRYNSKMALRLVPVPEMPLPITRAFISLLVDLGKYISEDRKYIFLFLLIFNSSNGCNVGGLKQIEKCPVHFAKIIYPFSHWLQLISAYCRSKSSLFR